MEAKLSEVPYGPTTIRETDPGQLTHMDLWGKYDTASINGNQYYLLMVDDATCHTMVEFLKNKSKAVQKVIEYLTYLKTQNKMPHAIQMDRGSEFVKDELISWCNANGIKLQLTTPYSPSQNGVAERMKRTLVELACAMLTDSKLPLFLWEPAVAHAMYLWNLSYTSVKPAVTPYQGWTGKKPNISHLHEFSMPIWVLLQGQSIQKKMLPKSQCCAYVGYDDRSKAIKYYNAATKNILLSRNFHFLMLLEPTPPEDIIIENPPEDQGKNSPPYEGEVDGSTCSRAKNQTTILQKQAAESNIDPREPQRMRGILLDYKYLNDPFPNEEEAGIASIAEEEVFTVLPDDDCRNLSEAKASPEWLDWEHTMQTELDQLKRMGTWRLIEKPPDVIPIGNKWVYVKKCNKEGQLIKYKARLVMKGYAQRPGYNYLETHSPVVRLESI